MAYRFTSRNGGVQESFALHIAGGGTGENCMELERPRKHHVVLTNGKILSVPSVKGMYVEDGILTLIQNDQDKNATVLAHGAWTAVTTSLQNAYRIQKAYWPDVPVGEE